MKLREAMDYARDYATVGAQNRRELRMPFLYTTEALARLRAEVNRLEARLERDAGTVAVPRELLEDCLEDMRDLRGEHDWHKDEPRCGHAAEYARLSERIARIETMLAGDGARGDALSRPTTGG